MILPAEKGTIFAMKVWAAGLLVFISACAPASRVVRCRVDSECEGAGGGAARCSTAGLCVWQDGGVVYPGVLIITIDDSDAQRSDAGS